MAERYPGAHIRGQSRTDVDLLHVDPMDDSPISLRPADESWMESDAATCIAQYCGHRRLALTGEIIRAQKIRLQRSLKAGADASWQIAER